MVVGEFMQEADVVVIGGGPGGYSAAFRAAELGASVVIVDSRPSLGGVCLHEGCIPSKSLLGLNETINAAMNANERGVMFSAPSVDIGGVRASVARSVAQLDKGLASRAASLGVEHIQGLAQFEDSRQLSVRESTVPRIRFRRAIIATGSNAIAHPALPFEADRIVTPAQAIGLAEIPVHLLIVGSSYVAIELAQIYAMLGSAVTVVTDDKTLLPEADADLARPVLTALRTSGVNIATNVTIAGVDQGGIAGAGMGTGMKVRFEGSKPPDRDVFDRVIVAEGFTANTAGLDLARTKVTCDADGFVVTDDQMRTTDPRIFAAGDVTGHPMLANVALHQGRIAGEEVAGQSSGDDAQCVPHAVFTDPQIAWCGLTETQAKAEGMEIGVTKMRWGASGRAVGIGRAEGVTKLVYERGNNTVLGVGICGPSACEMISEGVLAVEMGAEIGDLAGTLHPHPTFSELLMDAAHAAEHSE